MGEFSIYHWLIVLLIVVLFFGGRRIPEVMKGFGEGIRSFKTGLQDKDLTPDTPHETQGKSSD
jgi:sec-independent protein translocase protein TatA